MWANFGNCLSEVVRTWPAASPAQSSCTGHFRSPINPRRDRASEGLPLTGFVSDANARAGTTAVGGKAGPTGSTGLQRGPRALPSYAITPNLVGATVVWRIRSVGSNTS
jgi:hypothetical protein